MTGNLLRRLDGRRWGRGTEARQGWGKSRSAIGVGRGSGGNSSDWLAGRERNRCSHFVTIDPPKRNNYNRRNKLGASPQPVQPQLGKAGNRIRLVRLGEGETVQREQFALILRTVTSALFDENSYLISLPGRNDCVVVDPGLEPDRILEELDGLGVKPAAILNTHGHADHIAGNAALKDRWPACPLIIGAGDADKLIDPRGNLSADYGLPMVSPPADRTVSEGDVLNLAGVRWTVRETPGHSRGHIVFVALELSPVLVLGGDVLFAGSVGRTDFPDGNAAALAASIRDKLFTLPDDAVVLPGHGPPTTTGHEKRTNPYVGRGGIMLAS